MRSREPVPHLDSGGWLATLALFGSAPPPENTAKLLERMGRPQQGLKIVLVAGTNGKGSTAKLLASCLEADGRSVGLFVSPHLSDVTERIVTHGAAIGAADLERLLERLRPVATELDSTFFEVLTAAAMLRFAETGVEWAVVEVGLGGRLDPTNALEAVMALVTPIALDHQALLGHDVAQIAREKAGILRPGRAALTSAEGAGLRALRIAAARIGSELAVLGEEFAERVTSSSWDGLELEIWFDSGWLAAWRAALGAPADHQQREGLSPPLRLRTPLVGRHQARNLALAAAAALCLGVESAAISDAAEQIAWPGRLERLRHAGRWVVLDGAHNAHGAMALTEALVELNGAVDCVLLSVGRDKDARAMATALLRAGRAFIVTEADVSGRFMAAGHLASEVSAAAVELAADGAATAAAGAVLVEAVEDPHAGFARALELTPAGGTLVVAGSLHLVGELRSRLLIGDVVEQVG